MADSLHPFYSKFRTIDKRMRFGFVDTKVKATTLAKVVSVFLLFIGSLLLALVSIAEPFVVKIVLPAVAVPFIGMSAVLCDPQSRFMENKNEEWGQPKYLRKKVKQQLEMEQRIKEELTWCLEMFVDISEKNYDYLLIGSDYAKFRKAAKEVASGIEVFSMGKISTSLSPLLEDVHGLDVEYDRWVEGVRKERQVAEDLQKIWKSFLGPAKIPRERWTCSALGYDLALNEYGKMIGIESAIDAYVNGVPAADIVA